ncbi:MAG: hypothetical protein HQ592_06550 [Planctomycetes bacterium]|nr:hypothetical protein [Planctomycetota bacterium]
MSTKRLIAISLIIVFALGSCTSVVMLLRRDDPPPNDGDLRPTRLEIPDDENAFTYFDKACVALAWPEGEEDEKIDAIFDGEEWDAALVERLLKENEETFKWRDKGLACAQMQVPELDQGFATLLPYLSPWRKIAELSRLRALYLAKSGDEAGALDEAMKNVLFGRKIEESRGAIIHYVVAVAVKKIGLRTVREVLPETKLKADALNDLVKQLRLLGPDAEGLANAVRVEYAASCDEVDTVAASGAPCYLGL